LLHSDYGINQNTKMKLNMITKLLIDAQMRSIEEKLWQQWLVKYPTMDKSNFMSFDKFKELTFKPEKNVDNNKLTSEEAIEKANKIRNLDQGGGE